MDEDEERKTRFHVVEARTFDVGFSDSDCGFSFRAACLDGKRGGEKDVFTEEHAGFGPIFDDGAGVDASEGGTFLESGNGGGPDGTFRGGGVFEVVRRFELDEADFCHGNFGHFGGRG